ncbi:MAG: hypothetical protein LBJ74_02890, partial [Heliobacteriaceae bacterium]|nr:hypothetical protein [Heliobacteriaceae bacterium]
MVNFNVNQGQGITQAIKAKLQGEGADLKNTDLKAWQDVMDIVNEQQAKNTAANGPSIFTGAGKNTEIGSRENWKTDYKVTAGQEI